MSLRVRLTILSGVAVLAALFTGSLAVEPLCSVFRSTHHHGVHRVTSSQTLPATPTALAAHR